MKDNLKYDIILILLWAELKGKSVRTHIVRTIVLWTTEVVSSFQGD